MPIDSRYAAASCLTRCWKAASSGTGTLFAARCTPTSEPLSIDRCTPPAKAKGQALKQVPAAGWRTSVVRTPMTVEKP